MVAAIDFKALVKDKCRSIIAAHIQARLAQTGTSLCKGSPESHASFVVRNWKDGTAMAFLVLAETGTFATLRDVANAAGISEKAAQDFWRKTLRNMSVKARAGKGEEIVIVRLFRRGTERFFAQRLNGANGGVKLKLNTEMLEFALARFATSSTLGVTVAFRQNYEGAAAAQEADESRSEEERLEARASMHRETLPEHMPKPKQQGLFGT